MIILIVLSFLIVIPLMAFYGKQLKRPLLLSAVFLGVAIPFALQKKYYLFSLNDLHFNLADAFFALNIINFSINLVLRRAKLIWNKYTQIFFIFLLYFLTVPVLYSLASGDIFWLIRNLRVFLFLLYVPIFIDAVRTMKDVKLIMYSFLAGVLFALSLFYLHISGRIPIFGERIFELAEETRQRVFFIKVFFPMIGVLMFLGLWKGKFANKRWLWFIGIILSLITLLLCGGRADWICTLSGLIIICWAILKLKGLCLSKQGLKTVLSIFFILCILLAIGILIGGKEIQGYIRWLIGTLFDPTSPAYLSITKRINDYLGWSKYSLSNPINLIIGHGLGTVLPLDLYYEYNTESIWSAANQWMDILARGGLIGLTLFIWFQFEIFKLLLSIIRKIEKRSYSLLGTALLGTWIALLLYYTIAHSPLQWQCYGVTLGWMIGIIMFLRRQVILSKI